MATIRRTRKTGEHNPFCKRRLAEGLNTEVSIPSHFRCPVSLELMRDPVTLSTGITYDRQSIEKWLSLGNSTCPVTNQELTNNEIIPNHSIRRMIQDWCVANRSYGIERIPTPKIPLTHVQASEILSDVAALSRQGNWIRCLELVNKMKELGNESERNRRCIALAGAARVLASSFNSFGAGSPKILEEILSALAAYLPLDQEACYYIGSPESLNSIAAISQHGTSTGRVNAVLVLKDLLACNKEIVNLVMDTEGLIQTLVGLIKQPVSPHATKASLVATFYLVQSNEMAAARFVEMGIVPLLLDILVDSEKSTCEKALVVFNAICSFEAGRDEAYGNALTAPVLVKKMFRVSDMATELVVSALWKLCKDKKDEGEGGGEGCLVEALHVGAFQKLLLLLQVGCGGGTKEKVTDLLKLLNGFKGRLDCIDNLDFKGLKRSF